jgi:hypothetical protein
MVPIEKSSAGLNETDMLLRRELKLIYLAGIACLTIDQDPAILDHVALDLDLYGRPVGSLSGREGVPALDQIQMCWERPNRNFGNSGVSGAAKAALEQNEASDEYT